MSRQKIYIVAEHYLGKENRVRTTFSLDVVSHPAAILFSSLTRN